MDTTTAISIVTKERQSIDIEFRSSASSHPKLPCEHDRIAEVLAGCPMQTVTLHTIQGHGLKGSDS